MAAGDVFLVVVLILFPPLITIGVCCWLAHRCSRRPKVVITNKIYPAPHDDSGGDSDDYRKPRTRKYGDDDPDSDSDDDRDPPRRSGRR